MTPDASLAIVAYAALGELPWFSACPMRAGALPRCRLDCFIVCSLPGRGQPENPHRGLSTPWRSSNFEI